MTREEAITVIRKMLACTDLSVRANLNADMVDACHLAIKALEQEPVTDFADRCQECGKTIKQKYTEKVLNKIRAEINKAWYTKPKNRYEEGLKDQALKDMQIIDKYKAESEET